MEYTIVDHARTMGGYLQGDHGKCRDCKKYHKDWLPSDGKYRCSVFMMGYAQTKPDDTCIWPKDNGTYSFEPK